MSDERRPDGNGLIHVNADDVLDWLAQRNAHEARCPMCGYTKWTLFTGPEYASLVGMNAYPATVGNLGWGKPFVQVECKRCAYLGLFSAATISSWVAQGKPRFVEAGQDGE